MSISSSQSLETFEQLDYGDISDEELTASAAWMFAMFDEEEKS